ncbi:MAG: glucose-6-phosphate isomerase [gamma proteobacterium symbiont of Lucinoma myriamae]|nr:glucose-6-phosphate isomerase [gamma proteobacterium symbiont of Lucinoma myriamae]MCU7819682.1 glucose-6-phosphate isomerase [gamma proteobacterium symbiont of Lucinoma myriamae]MCU7831561.1 glucose-6-phosphate isomerase [gamma proteobacterium symbiont of Lucinoma myriamae]
MNDLIESTAWLKLKEHYETIKDVHMRDLFAEEPQRFEAFSASLNDILLDYSKNRVTDETMELLFALARQANVEEWRDNMLAGMAINSTENRSVLHMALRNRSNKPIRVDGRNVMPKVKAVLAHMRDFSEQVRSGEWHGYNGDRIKSIVNIGIGGSDLGPHVVCESMKPFAQRGLKAYFVSNADATHLVETLKQVEPESTLFVIASKTFTTQETMLNAYSARKWFMDLVGNEKAIEKHFVAVTTNIELAGKFGINEANIFEFWDWVGGRYSLWSSVGLTIALYLGMDHFESLLEGAYDMDQHFQNAPLEENIPVILALLGIWYNNFFDAQSHAIMPYSQYLERLPDYLQQLDMESNGKTIDRKGHRVNYLTGPIIWGQSGTNGQHAFFQLLHQGTKPVPADFLIPALSQNPLGLHHRVLFSNCLAQTKALMLGKKYAEAVDEMKHQGFDKKTIEEVIQHKVFDGNKPTNTIIFERLTPKTLGSILAMYEHKVFVQGIIWNINSYDQWGVEYGKVLAGQIQKDLSKPGDVENHDSSTNGLINYRKRVYFDEIEKSGVD